MRSPKGFGKGYFSLATILAFSASAVMASQIQSINDHEKNAFHKKVAKEDDKPEEEPIVITKKLDIKEVDAPFASEIYTKRDIKNSHPVNIYDFLNSATSLNTLPSYGNPLSQLIDLRGYGLESGYENVVVTVDGRRLNNIDMQPQLLSSICMDEVKKVEILKGSGSVEYGDGANGGVINIVTDGFNGVKIGGSLGSYGAWSDRVDMGIKKERFSISGYITKSVFDGERIIAADGTKNSYENNNKGFRFSLTPFERLKLTLSKTFYDADIYYPNALTLAQYENDPKTVPNPSWGILYNHQYYKDNALSYTLEYKINDSLRFDLRGSNEKKLSDFITYFSTNRYDYDSYGSKLTYQKDGLKVLLGYDKFNGKRENLSKTEKNSDSYYISAYYALANSNFLAGARREKAEYIYNSPTQHLKDSDYLNAFEFGYNFKFSKNSSLFLNYNRSFQFPDVDRFFSYDFTNAKYIFNGFIEPMKVDNYNIGYNYFGYPHHLKATLFYSDIKNEIYYNAVIWQNTNLDKTRKYGFEFEEKYNFFYNLYLKLNYSFVDTKIRKNSSDPTIEGNEIPGVSKHKLKLALSYSPTYRWNMTLSHTYASGSYAMSDFDKSFKKTDDYHVSDFVINYRYKNANFFAKVNNIFDRKNALFVDNGTSIGVYPTNYERRFLFGASVKF